MVLSFSQFIRERQYLHNVSPATVEWYKCSFKWLRSETPTEEELRDAVVRMREKGLKATGCNSAIRAINAYLKWSGFPHRVLYLKEDQRVLPTFTPPDIKKLLSYKPKNFYQRRLHLIILVLLDTGCRIDEVLSLRASDCDLDNLLLTVTGKGRKQRKIPFSFELRRVLSRFLRDFPSELVFATRKHGGGRKLGRRVVLRDVKLLCQRLGITPPERTLHAFRHTFAIHYLRKGGSVFHLQKVLGHSTLEMTRRYGYFHFPNGTANSEIGDDWAISLSKGVRCCASCWWKRPKLQPAASRNGAVSTSTQSTHSKWSGAYMIHELGRN